MPAPILHSDQVGINLIVGENIRLAGQVGLLTDAQVIAATTSAELQSLISTNALTAHADVRGYVDRLQESIEFGKSDGTLTDANIQAATGVDNLASLTLSNPGKVGPILE